MFTGPAVLLPVLRACWPRFKLRCVSPDEAAGAVGAFVERYLWKLDNADEVEVLRGGIRDLVGPSAA